MTIADAPYIREAELLGMPPYGDDPDYSDAEKTLLKCDKQIDTVVDLLLDAEQQLEGSGFENEIRDLIYKIEDIGCDVRSAANKAKFGYDR